MRALMRVVRNRNFWMPSACAVAVFLLYFFKLVDFHELDGVDLRFRLRGQKPADSSIVLVVIDDASVQALGQWPWPRRVYAALWKS